MGSVQRKLTSLDELQNNAKNLLMTTKSIQSPLVHLAKGHLTKLFLNIPIYTCTYPSICVYMILKCIFVD